jgi:hypothetical protein
VAGIVGLKEFFQPIPGIYYHIAVNDNINKKSTQDTVPQNFWAKNIGLQTPKTS